MLDVVISGAGPAGAVAATVLARAGARVRLVDRAAFPRDKLCGDTLNPGALSVLRRLGMAGEVERVGLPVAGMLVTGDARVAVEGRYPRDLAGRAITRRALDALLLEKAIAAGAEFDESTPVAGAIAGRNRGGACVEGLVIGRGARRQLLHARLTIAADGRRSPIAVGLGLLRTPARPRRWAVGAYFDTFAGVRDVGEMHVRAGHYIGVVAVPGGLVNVCLVTDRPGSGGDPATRLRQALEGDALLRDRCAGARLVTAPVTLGPLAADVDPRAIPGLFLAGDAAGFIDPMTGDGLRFALRGGELAAEAALAVLEHGWSRVGARLLAERTREFSRKQRFNRVLRALVDRPSALRLVASGANVAPMLVKKLIAIAGDCNLVEESA